MARVDFAYDPGMIVLEALGYRHHSTREQQSHDAERASEHRSVGIISHVPLVQEAIPNGFYVRKGVSGSSVELRGD